MTGIALNNVAAASGFRSPLKAREIYLHDGKSLRRLRLSVPLQLSAMAAAVSALCLSVFATAQIATTQPAPAVPGDAKIAQMQREVQAMRADVQAIRADVEERYEMTAEEVRRLGLDPQRFEGVGGPLEEVPASDPNFKALFASWKQLDTLEQGTVSIPSAKPVKDARFTSSFGIRSDPFQGRAAMHGGIDLAGPVGTEIYATADGIVNRSGWNSGGYGNLVEVNHGKGIQTRYGHLSQALVQPGERVKRGQLIALMGSTGRSTGSHLHYEVRIDGKAVNPVPYLQSTDYLQSVQARAASTASIGGPVAGSK